MVVARTPSKILQNTIDAHDVVTDMKFLVVHESQLDQHHLSSIFNSTFTIGLSPAYAQGGALTALGISDEATCYVIELFSQRGREGKRRSEVLKEFLCRENGDFYAFDMGPLAMSLLDTTMAIVNAVDIQSAFYKDKGPPKRLEVLEVIEQTMGGMNGTKVNTDTIMEHFQTLCYNEDDPNRAISLGQRAWISQFVVGYSNGPLIFDKVPRINTVKLNGSMILAVIQKLTNDQRRHDEQQPSATMHKFEVTQSSDGKMTLKGNEYKTKFRGGQKAKMMIRTSDGTTYSEDASIGTVLGKNASMKTEAIHLDGKEVIQVVSTGGNTGTAADRERSDKVLAILQGKTQMLNRNPWIQNVWLSTSPHLKWPSAWSLLPSEMKEKFTIIEPPSGLNRSQKGAVRAMLSSKASACLLLLEGPPGSGKTSVIGSYVLSAIQAGRKGIWLIAQSNVAVKNIAEKLHSLQFHNWKILISDDFHYDWHEHIYANIPQSNCIISKDFRTLSPSSIEGIPVFLCTLSMLSNALVSKFIYANKIETIVVDEASQIEIGNYLPIFLNPKISHTLHKCCFIGDDRQLPPFGQEEIQDLQSIFEVKHLEDTLSLDTQYRMPPQVGDIISQLVYEGELKSNMKHPIQNTQTACFFYDTPSMEEKSGTSYKNSAETTSVLEIAKFLQFRNLAFKIITPYDGQRNFIETALKNDPDLDWENKCFNVDSFQGNEDDYIIVSLVRTRQLGFLANLRRTNVMLTRFRKGMFIVSSETFLGPKGIGRNSLAGELLSRLGNKVGRIGVADLAKGNFFNHY